MRLLAVVVGLGGHGQRGMLEDERHAEADADAEEAGAQEVAAAGISKIANHGFGSLR